jgi:hypothetical protein
MSSIGDDSSDSTLEDVGIPLGPASMFASSPLPITFQIWHSWLDFVYSARIHKGIYRHLGDNETKCDCRQSSVSYPHWPPTTVKEAFDLLVYQQDLHNHHKRYLAHQWWVFVRAMGSTCPQNHRSGVYENLAFLILDFCPCIQHDMDMDLSIQPRPKGWGCYDYCTRVLDKGDGCLCFCTEHRDECPTHGRQ